MNFRVQPDPPPEVFRARREAVSHALGAGVLVLPAAPVQHASRDTERPYWPDRELYYLTGLSEPGTVAVLSGGGDARLTVFSRERDADAELWAGPRLGPEGAARRSAADDGYPLSDLGQKLADLLRPADMVFSRAGQDAHVDALVAEALQHTRARGPRTGTGPRGVIDPGVLLDELRLIKDASEVDAIRAACAVTLAGHRAGAAAIAAGVGEWVIQAAVDGAFLRGGAHGPAFETIVGSGANACVLHYVANAGEIGAGDLVLVDAGANVGMYHGDVTRTYPANGVFSGPQRDVYQLVDAARAAGIDATRPGATIADVHEASTRVLTRGLVDLGVLTGDVDTLIEDGAHKPWFPHQTSHWLGLDVHDVGNYAAEGAPRTLEAGMVFTIEPGLYFRPGGGPDTFEGIGVRIEDDVVVTPEGREVLTAGLPTSAGDIEDLLRS